MINKLKNVIYTGLSIVLVLFTASCVNYQQEDTTGHSTLNATNPGITITSDFDNVPPVEEEMTYPFTLTLSEPQVADIKVAVYQSAGDATEGLDFTIDSPVIVIPAYAMSASGSITIHADEDAEPTETFAITIGDETLANTSFTPETFVFTIDNWVALNLNIAFDWETEVDWNGTLYPTCNGNIDIDVLVSYAEGFDINDPWATFTGNWDGATSSCPETIIIDPTEWEDGEYVFWSMWYANGFYGLNTNTFVPVTSIATRAGSFSSTVVQDPSQQNNTDDPSWVDDATDNIYGECVRVKVENGIFTVINYGGDNVGQGKASTGKAKTPIPVNPNK